MATCENCGKSGLKAEEMLVAEYGPYGEKALIGPECIGAELNPGPRLDYHLEFSSKNGLVATVSYGGLQVQYRKSPEQLRRTYEEYAGQSQQEVPLN